MQFKAKTKEWGNSLGIVIPKETVKRTHIKPNEEIIIEIKERNILQETFGTIKEWKINSQKAKDELRKAWR